MNPSKGSNGTFKWIAGILATLLVGVTASFAGFHINTDIRQSEKIEEHNKSIGCIETDLKNINKKLDSILIEVKQKG